MFAFRYSITLFGKFISRERKAQKLKKKGKHSYISLGSFRILTTCESKDLRLTNISSSFR